MKVVAWLIVSKMIDMITMKMGWTNINQFMYGFETSNIDGDIAYNIS